MNQWNEIASLTARNFEKDRPCYFKFEYMKNFCPYFYLIENLLLYLLRFSKKHGKNDVIFKIFWRAFICYRIAAGIWFVLRGYSAISKKM